MATAILIVDPVPTNRVLYSSMLSEVTTDITLAATAQEAVLAARRTRPDLVLCAFNLPDTSMQALFDRMNDREDPPAILALQNPAIAARLTALEAGADDVVSLPVDAAMLRAQVRAALRSARRNGSVAVLSRLARGLAENAPTFQRPRGIIATGRNLDRVQAIVQVLQSSTGHPITVLPVDQVQAEAPHDPKLVILIDDASNDDARQVLQTLGPNQLGPATTRLVLTDAPDAALFAAGADQVTGLQQGLPEACLRIARWMGDPPAVQPKPAQSPRTSPAQALSFIRFDGLPAADQSVSRLLKQHLPDGALIEALPPDVVLCRLPNIGNGEVRRCALRLRHALTCHQTNGRPISARVLTLRGTTPSEDMPPVLAKLANTRPLEADHPLPSRA